jgi:hypothetical protein
MHILTACNKPIHRRIMPLAIWLLMVVIHPATGTFAQQSPGENSGLYKKRTMLLRDEGLSQLSYIDLANSQANWFVKVPPGRDIQLAGNGRVMIGTGNGFEEYEITTGKKVFELASFPGTISARRLRNGNTMLVGADWQEKKGIVLVEVDKNGSIKRKIVYPPHTYLRLIRETTAGTFLVTADELVFEGNDKGEIIWQATLAGLDKPHSWQALRLGNGQTIVSTGYDKNFQVFSKEGKLLDSITGPPQVHPLFYAGFQVLANGNYVVTNWQGHGPSFGSSGTQVLEYTPAGKLAWSWKQDAGKFSSLQGIIVLDGLNIQLLHVEDGNGKLSPVK